MKKIILIILYFLLFSCTSKKVKIDLDRNNIDLNRKCINGKVKTIFTQYYSAEALHFPGRDDIPIERLEYSKVLSKYNEKGLLIENDQISYDGSIEQTDNFIYDDVGNVTEIIGLGADGKLLFKDSYSYDYTKKNIEVSRFNSYGKLLFKDYYKYDEKGNKTEEYRDDIDGKHISKYSYEYDAKGNDIEMSYYNSRGSIYKTLYKYDEKGNVIEEIEYNSLGKVVNDFSYYYKYEFDYLGNWIKLYRFSYVKELNAIIKCKITYYE